MAHTQTGAFVGALVASASCCCCCQDEIAEMKRKFKIMGHQIEQLKEEISAKDLALVKEHFDHMKVCLMLLLLAQPAPTLLSCSNVMIICVC